MNKEEILKELEFNRGYFPEEAINAAIKMKDEIIPDLVHILSYCRENIIKLADGKDDYFAHIHASFLLAQFKAKNAIVPFLALISHHDIERIDVLFGDFITENLPNIVLSLYDNDLLPLKQVIENKQADEFVRGSVLRALTGLYIENKISREEIIDYLKELTNSILEREYSTVWDDIVDVCVNLQIEEMKEEVYKIFEEELTDFLFIRYEEYEAALKKPPDTEIKMAQKLERYHPITDIAMELGDWACFKTEENNFYNNDICSVDDDNYDIHSSDRYFKENTVLKPVISGVPKIGRNEPCPCGSSKKYKKCCGIGN